MNNTTEIAIPGVLKPDLPAWVFGLCAFYLFILGILSIFFNSSILWLFMKVKNLRTDFNLLLMNLLSGELMVACYGIPIDFYASARHGWDLGHEVCQVTGFLLTFLGMASINNLVAISIFRYLVIRYANSNFPVYSRKVVLALITLSWTYSLLLALPPLLGWGKFAIEVNGMSCAPSWRDRSDSGYNITLFILGFFLPLGIIILTGIRILFIVREHLATVTCQIGDSARKKEEKLSQMIVVMVTVFVICWGPYAAQSLAGVMEYHVPLALSVFPLQFAKLAVLANPLIYVIMNKTFQKAFINILPNDLRQVFAEKIGIEKGTLSDTAIGRRQQPRFFGRLWTTIMVRKSSEAAADTSGYFE